MKTENSITLAQCAEYLLAGDNYLIFCHAAPDGDTIGSGLALAYALHAVGKRARVFCPDAVPTKLGFMLEDAEILTALPADIYTPVSVDIASPAMLKGLDPEFVAKLVFGLSIDHHDVNTVRAERMYVDPAMPAAGEIIAELTAILGVPFDKKNAVWLYTAISSDSGCFRYSSTLPSTFRTAASLIETGIDFAWINRRIFECKSKGQLALEKNAYENLEFFFGGKVAVVTLSDEALALPEVEDSDVEQINSIPREIAGVEVSLVVRRRGDEIKVSFRSNDYYNVASLAKSFGGGGHIHAAGCRFRTDTDSACTAKMKIIERLRPEFDER